MKNKAEIKKKFFFKKKANSLNQKYRKFKEQNPLKTKFK